MNSRIASILIALIISSPFLTLGSCATAPKEEDKPLLISEARAVTKWFESRIPGLSAQLDQSAGYVIFPDVAQWGILVGGGKFGRGVAFRANDVREGWSSINTGSLGLQAGVQGFRMLVIFETPDKFNEFRSNNLSGSMSGIAVLGESGTSRTAPFKNGIVIYQGANTGLMAGVNIGLDYLRFEPR